MLNVVVEESLRGNGIGTALMAAATDMAVQQWQAERMYTHVDCHNEARTVGNLMLQQHLVTRPSTPASRDLLTGMQHACRELATCTTMCAAMTCATISSGLLLPVRSFVMAACRVCMPSPQSLLSVMLLRRQEAFACARTWSS